MRVEGNQASVVVWKLREETTFSEKGLPVSYAAVRLNKARPGTSSLALAVQRSLMTLRRRVEEAIELMPRKWRGQV